MSPEGKEIWREIIASKPLDWFDADQLRSLIGHCENRASLNDLTIRLSKEEPGTKAFRQLAIDMKFIATVVTSSARNLRLTVQNTADRSSTKNGERGSVRDELMGGAAVTKRIRAVK
jgi:hypothetical protein